MMCRVAASMPQYTPAAMGDMDVGRDVLIGAYFEHGYRNKDIIQLLFIIHGISLSLSHLKRLLKTVASNVMCHVSDSLWNA